MSRRVQYGFSAAAMTVACSILFGIIFGGCGKTEDPPRNLPTGEKKPILEGWKAPAFALVISGQQHGYLEPCGCTAESRIGGFAHRADLFRKLREKRKWNVAGVDLGDLIAIRRGGEIARFTKQDELKLQQILSGLTKMGYVAAGLGRAELQTLTLHGSFFLLTQPNVGIESETKLPFVGANINLQDLGPRKWHKAKVGDKTIAVTALFGTKYRNEMLPAGSESKVITDPAKQLPPVIAEMKKAKPDMMVLLAYADKKTETAAIAKQHPEFDLIVTAGGHGEGSEEPTWVGKTAIIEVGIKGKHVGVVGFYPDAGKPADRLRFELVELDAERFDDDPVMHDLMKEYQAQIVSNKEQVFSDLKATHPSGLTYAGVDSCKGCHTKAYARWSKTKHARGYESLLKGRKGEEKNWIKRHMDPECLACHVTGWHPQKIQRYGSGFLPESLANDAGKPHLFKNLRGQQCENCHGPGSRHVDLEKQWEKDADKMIEKSVLAARKSMKLTIEGVKQTRLCYQCHDLDNSPSFDFDKYWKEVEHKGKD